MATAVAKKKSKHDLSGVKGIKITTPRFIASFPKVFKPEAFKEGDKAAYSVTMLFDSKTDLKEMKQAVLKAKIEAFGKDKESWPEISSPWRDGNEKTDLRGYEGKTYANCKTYNKPLVIDASKEKIEDESDIYPGAICRASLVVKAVDAGGKYYVTFYLQGLQKLKDGENLGGGASADDFDDEEVEEVEEDEIDDDEEVEEVEEVEEDDED